MLLKLTHETSLKYSDFITETIMELRVAPRQSDDQLRMSFTLGVNPSASVTSYFDWLGNLVHVFTSAPLHQYVQIVATSIVETRRAWHNLSSMPDTWPLDPLDFTFHDYLQFDGPITDCPELQAIKGQLDPVPGMPLGTVILQMLRIIHTEFTYEKGITTASTPVSEVLKHRRGVCQDFTHVMIACARALGIPARYVSGIIHSGDTALRGAAQTHAWVELYFPSTGWIGSDPTNNAFIDDRFVTVAIGRDYRDVPPNRGVYRGKAQEQMNVAVTTEVLQSASPHLTGERIQILRTPTQNLQANDLSERHAKEQLRLQQEQQQQQ